MHNDKAAMTPGILLWGAGGHGKVVLDAILAGGSLRDLRVYDDDERKAGAQFCGFFVVTGRDPWIEKAPPLRQFVICIGDNPRRAQCYEAAQRFLPAATVIHPSAIVSPAARIGPGCVVLARAVINAGAIVGRNCIVNTGAIVEHDCQIGDHVHIGPGAILGGSAAVDSFGQVGMGAVVLPRVRIGERALAGAGAVVNRDVPPGIIVAGVPARPLDRLRDRKSAGVDL